MNMSAIITRFTVLFLVLALGYLGNKTKILSASGNKLISSLILNITMPCTILASVMNGSVTATVHEALLFIVFTLIYFVITFVIAWPLPRIFKIAREDRGIIRFLMIFGNVAFMGYPVIQSIYGDPALFYVTLFNIPFNLLLFSVGIILTSGKSEKLNVKLFLTPTLFASMAAILIFVFKLTVPKVISDSALLLGQITTPGSMLVIGSTLACIPIREVFTDLRVYPAAVLKLIFIPVLTWLVLRFLVTDAQTLGVLIVEAGMPTATAAAMLSLQYGGNERLASKGVFITTLFSVVTIPLLLYFLF